MITAEQFNTYAAGFESILTGFGILIGGIWALRKYVFQQERYPNIEFSAEIRFIGKHGNQWILELIAIIENKGKAQHKMRNLEFDLGALYESDAIEISHQYGGQVHFPHNISVGSFLPKHNKFFFVDPGVKAKYSYIASVPLEAKFLLLHCWFNYFDKRKFSHTAEASIEVPKVMLDDIKK